MRKGARSHRAHAFHININLCMYTHIFHETDMKTNSMRGSKKQTTKLNK